MTTTDDWTVINKATWPAIQTTRRPRPDGKTGFTLTSKLDGHPYPFGITLIGNTDSWGDLDLRYAAAGMDAMAEYAAAHV